MAVKKIRVNEGFGYERNDDTIAKIKALVSVLMNRYIKDKSFSRVLRFIVFDDNSNVDWYEIYDLLFKYCPELTLEYPANPDDLDGSKLIR